MCRSCCVMQTRIVLELVPRLVTACMLCRAAGGQGVLHLQALGQEGLCCLCIARALLSVHCSQPEDVAGWILQPRLHQRTSDERLRVCKLHASLPAMLLLQAAPLQVDHSLHGVHPESVCSPAPTGHVLCQERQHALPGRHALATGAGCPCSVWCLPCRPLAQPLRSTGMSHLLSVTRTARCMQTVPCRCLLRTETGLAAPCVSVHAASRCRPEACRCKG